MASVSGMIGGQFSEGVARGKELAEGLADGLNTGISRVTGGLARMAGNISEKIRGMKVVAWGREMASGIADGIRGGVSWVTGGVARMIDGISTTVGGAASKALAWGRGVVGGIADGLGAGASRVTGGAARILGVVSGVIGGAASRAWGTSLVQKLAAGIGTGVNWARGAASSVLAGVSGAMGAGLSAATAWGASLVRGLSSGIRAGVSLVSGAFGKLVGGLSLAGGALKRTASLGLGIAKGIAGGITSGVSLVKTAVSTLISGITGMVGSVVSGVSTIIGKVTSMAGSLMRSLDPASQMQQYGITMNVLLKDPRKAKARLAELKKFAGETNFDIREVVESSNLMQAFGIHGNGLERLKLAGDAANAFGKDIREVVTSLNYLGSGRGGEAFESLARIGVTRDALKPYGVKFNAQGSLITPTKKALDAVFKYFEDKYGGMTARMGRTWSGALRIAGSEWFNALSDGLTSALRPLTSFVNDSITPLIRSFGSFLKTQDFGRMLRTPLAIGSGLLSHIRRVLDPRTRSMGLSEAKALGAALIESGRRILEAFGVIGRALIMEGATIVRNLADGGLAEFGKAFLGGLTTVADFFLDSFNAILSGFSDRFKSDALVLVEKLIPGGDNVETHRRQYADQLFVETAATTNEEIAQIYKKRTEELSEYGKKFWHNPGKLAAAQERLHTEVVQEYLQAHPEKKAEYDSFVAQHMGWSNTGGKKADYQRTWTTVTEAFDHYRAGFSKAFDGVGGEWKAAMADVGKIGIAAPVMQELRHEAMFRQFDKARDQWNAYYDRLSENAERDTIRIYQQANAPLTRERLTYEVSSWRERIEKARQQKMAQIAYQERRFSKRNSWTGFRERYDSERTARETERRQGQTMREVTQVLTREVERASQGGRPMDTATVARSLAGLGENKSQTQQERAAAEAALKNILQQTFNVNVPQDKNTELIAKAAKDILSVLLKPKQDAGQEPAESGKPAPKPKPQPVRPMQARTSVTGVFIRDSGGQVMGVFTPRGTVYGSMKDGKFLPDSNQAIPRGFRPPKERPPDVETRKEKEMRLNRYEKEIEKLKNSEDRYEITRLKWLIREADKLRSEIYGPVQRRAGNGAEEQQPAQPTAAQAQPSFQPVVVQAQQAAQPNGGQYDADIAANTANTAKGLTTFAAQFNGLATSIATTNRLLTQVLGLPAQTA